MPGNLSGTPHCMQMNFTELLLVIGCCCVAGGTSIEDLAEKYPEKIIKIPIDVFEGITDDQVKALVC